MKLANVPYSWSVPEPLANALRDVLASASRWGPMLVIAAAVTFFLADRWSANGVVQGVSWLVIGFLALPFGFTIALSAVALVLTVVLSALALPFWLSGRRTGLRDLLRDAWGLAGHVLPGFWCAVRRVRRPRLWGAMAGSVVGCALFVLLRGFGTG
ncbi:MAG: hypothetical protein NXI31_08540 [bacterium]|nr:hypothetical protein [bacterium]